MNSLRAFITTIVMIISAVACSSHNYGKKMTVGRSVVYYSKDITEEQANNTITLLDGLDSLIHNKPASSHLFQLIKKSDTIFLKKAVDKDNPDSLDQSSILTLGNMVSNSIFNGLPVTIEMTNSQFEPYETVPYQKVNLEKVSN